VPAQNVAVPHFEFLQRSNRHDLVIHGLGQVEARLQKLVAELVMMRLFDEFQDAVAGIALRLACGTPYADGTIPNLLTAPAKSTSSARDLFETLGRAKRKYVKWSRASYINDATKYVLDATDPFTAVCTANALIISEMQAVRNRIAHANTKSRVAFSNVVQRHYGAKLNNVSPGVLLLSSRFSPPLLEQYVAACRVITKACARA
jgi:hypothetical protein